MGGLGWLCRPEQIPAFLPQFPHLLRWRQDHLQRWRQDHLRISVATFRSSGKSSGHTDEARLNHRARSLVPGRRLKREDEGMDLFS